MKNKVICSIVLFLFLFAGANAQSDYEVGFSRVSTEPDSTLFSVAISGYGYPPEGRFSIEWLPVGDMPGKIAAMTGMGSTFYAADSAGVLWKGIVFGGNIHWQKASMVNDVKALAGMNGRLYAINNKGQLLESKIRQKRIKWEMKGKPSNIEVLAALDDKLYACSSSGELLRLNPDSRTKTWDSIGKKESTIIGMTSRGQRLFAISAGDTLWHILPFKDHAPWTEMGRYNGITFNIYIKQLAVLDNHLYAVSKDNKLFISRQSTDGDLSATAMAIRQGNEMVVIEGVDLTGFDHSLTDDVKEIVSRQRNIPKSAILINASHTHFSPTAQAYPAWMPFLRHPDSLYLNNILKKAMVEAIEKAIDNMQPARLYFGRGTSNIGLNRSSADPEVPVDHTLDVLVAKNNQQIKGVLFLTACHAVFNNSGKEGFTLSANFPGVARNLIREKTGANSIFIQGCAGDINPRSTNHTETGTELANDVIKIINGEMEEIKGGISFSMDSMDIPIHPWSIEKVEQFRKDNSGKPDDVEAVKNVRWANLMLERYRKGAVADFLPEYIQFLNIGDWKMVGLSREAVNEYGPAVRKLYPRKMVSVAGYCNDVPSYLPKEWHLVTQTYEGYGSFFWYGQPGIPPINVFDIVVKAVKKAGEKSY